MNEFLEVGRVVNLHGIRGELKMEPWCDDVSFLQALQTLFLAAKGAQPAHLVSVRPHKNHVLLKLEGVDTADAAEKLKNRVLYCRRADAPLDEGSVFVQDLIGCRVVDADSGADYGEITDVLNHGSCDIYEVKNGKTVHLLPAIDDVVVCKDIENRVVQIRRMKGLFDED